MINGTTVYNDTPITTITSQYQKHFTTLEKMKTTSLWQVTKWAAL